ncbi:alpha/beta hydrolase [bacterium]|nr:alpha/beta hydrolase [bacterium]
MYKRFFLLVWFAWIASGVVLAQTSTSDVSMWAAEIGGRYYVVPNVTYLVADNIEIKLDVYVPRHADAANPVPTVIYIHGGGWMGGDKNVSVLHFLPYLEMGWAAVNVNYRAGPSTAPKAVADCRCALRWVIRNAKKYNFDVNKLVVTGESAGSHLSLTTGILPATTGLDELCSGTEELKVAAIINWYGITDVVDVSEGKNQQSFAVEWLSNLPDPKATARLVSPIQYVRPGLPPILTIHGDSDWIAPYDQAVRLHKALDSCKVPNQLLTIPGGFHGGFTREERIKIYATIRKFLQSHVISK